MENKICSKCEIDKPISEYHTSNGKHISICKICKNKANKKYQDNNKNYFKLYNETYKIENKEKLSEYRKEFYKQYNKGGELESRRTETLEKNKDKICHNKKLYNLKNKDKIKDYMKIYGQINREKLNDYKQKYNKEKPHIKIWISVLTNTLKRFGKEKEAKTIDLLGYSPIDLKHHIEILFTEGMTWDNYGEWHVDHIKPVISFDKETQIMVVNALSNLQPLWATTREINGIIYQGNLNKNKY